MIEPNLQKSQKLKMFRYSSEFSNTYLAIESFWKKFYGKIKKILALNKLATTNSWDFMLQLYNFNVKFQYVWKLYLKRIYLSLNSIVYKSFFGP